MYVLGDARLVIEHSDQQQLARIARLWEQLFVVADASPGGTDLVATIRFGVQAESAPCDSEGRLVFGGSGLRVWRLPGGFKLSLESSEVQVDLTDGVARGMLGENFWGLPAEQQRRFLLLAWVMLSHGCGYYALHANGVAGHGGGWLLVGPSGCGKTTLGLQLVRQGWDYLSDDVVLLRRKASAVVAYGVTRGFSCMARHADGNGLADNGDGQSGQDKWILDADTLSVDRQASQCRPGFLLFPEITAQRTSRLFPIAATESLVRLISFSAGIMVDHAKSKSQLKVLGQLVDQSSSYRFLAGTDVLDEPSRVARLLRATSEV